MIIITMHNPAPVQENDSHKFLWDFNIQTDHLIPTRRPDLIIINRKKKKKENPCLCWLASGDVNSPGRRREPPAALLERSARSSVTGRCWCCGGPRKNLKESEKKGKYLDLARELKKLWNMKVRIVPIVIGALGTKIKGLLKSMEDLEVGGREETIQTTALLRTARILRRVLET